MSEVEFLELADVVGRSVRDLGGAGATSVVFQGSAEEPHPGPLLRALTASAGPAAASAEPEPSE